MAEEQSKLRHKDDLVITLRDDYWCGGSFIRLLTVEGLPKVIIPFREWVHSNIAPDTIRFEDEGQALYAVGSLGLKRRTMRVHFPQISDEEWILIKMRWFK